MPNLENCPICDIGVLERSVVAEGIRYRETNLRVQIELSRCKACGEETIGPELARQNDLAVRIAYKQAHQLLPGKMIKAVRTHLGLTQKAAARLFGGGSNSFAKYEAESVVQSKSADILLRLAYDNPSIVESVERLVNHVETITVKELGHVQNYLVMQSSILNQAVLRSSSVKLVECSALTVKTLSQYYCGDSLRVYGGGRMAELGLPKAQSRHTRFILEANA